MRQDAELRRKAILESAVTFPVINNVEEETGVVVDGEQVFAAKHLDKLLEQRLEFVGGLWDQNGGEEEKEVKKDEDRKSKKKKKKDRDAEDDEKKKKSKKSKKDKKAKEEI
jgi:hypothetical protein